MKSTCRFYLLLIKLSFVLRCRLSMLLFICTTLIYHIPINFRAPLNLRAPGLPNIKGSNLHSKGARKIKGRERFFAEQVREGGSLSNAIKQANACNRYYTASEQ